MIRLVVDPNLILRAVVDTNILIRAPIIPRLAQGEYVIVYSEPLLQEFDEKMALPRRRRQHDFGSAVHRI